MIPQVGPQTTLVEFYRQLVAGFPMVSGREVELTTAATALEQKLPHGLGRAYRGGVQLSTTGSLLVVLDPSLQDDADLNVTFIDTLATAGTTRIWVY